MQSKVRRRRYRTVLRVGTVLTALLIGNVVGAQEPTEANVRYTRKAKKASAKSGLLKTEFEAKKREFEDYLKQIEAGGERETLYDPRRMITGGPGFKQIGNQ